MLCSSVLIMAYNQKLIFTATISLAPAPLICVTGMSMTFDSVFISALIWLVSAPCVTREAWSVSEVIEFVTTSERVAEFSVALQRVCGDTKHD